MSFHLSKCCPISGAFQAGFVSVKFNFNLPRMHARQREGSSKTGLGKRFTDASGAAASRSENGPVTRVWESTLAMASVLRGWLDEHFAPFCQPNDVWSKNAWCIEQEKSKKCLISKAVLHFGNTFNPQKLCLGSFFEIVTFFSEFH